MSAPSAGPAAAPPLSARGIGVGGLLVCFGKIGLLGFGGVLPVVIHEVVNRRRWIDLPEFTEILAMCQVLPGPNVVNFAVVFGMRTAGWPGVLAAVTGILVLPVVIVMIVATLYVSVGSEPVVQNAVRAVSQGAAGLVTALALRLWWPHRRRWLVTGIVALVMVCVVVLRLPLAQVLALAAPLSVALAVWQARRHG